MQRIADFYASDVMKAYGNFAAWPMPNSQGLAEGSPRVGATQVTGGQFFVGRPILPRRISVTATYSF